MVVFRCPLLLYRNRGDKLDEFTEQKTTEKKDYKQNGRAQSQSVSIGHFTVLQKGSLQKSENRIDYRIYGLPEGMDRARAEENRY